MVYVDALWPGGSGRLGECSQVVAADRGGQPKRSDGRTQELSSIKIGHQSPPALLVVGTVIGTGVYIKSAIMAQDAASPLLVLTAWVAAGSCSNLRREI
ncbi:MAG: hypothetical protein ABIS29_11300 [Vicinamibacterales bacterium]